MKAAQESQIAQTERALLSLLVSDGSLLDVVIETGIRAPANFSTIAHRDVFTALLALHDRGATIDPELVSAELAATPDARASRLSAQDLAGWVRSLHESPTRDNVLRYAQLVREASVRRQLRKMLEEAARAVVDPSRPITETKTQLENQLHEIDAATSRTEPQLLRRVLGQAFEVIQARHENQGKITGLETGFEDLDSILGGWQRKDLVLVGARPSMGKSSFMLRTALHVAQTTKEPVIIFSLEMSNESLGIRTLAMEGRVNSAYLRSGRLTDAEFARMGMVANRFYGSPVYFDDGNQSVADMRLKCRRIRARHGSKLGLIAIDYAQLAETTLHKNAKLNREQVVAETSRRMKAMGKELDAPVLALVQLNRELERRADKRPLISDLRETGQLEQDADVICFLYRDEVYNKDSPDKGVAEVIIAKHRNGDTGLVRLAWQSEYTRFESLTRGP